MSNGSECQKTICKIHIINYTRHDPKTIECIADNKKSVRISKIFNINVICKLSSYFLMKL